VPSERVQRQIDALLDEADAALRRFEWDVVRERALDALALDPGNGDAEAYRAAASADWAVGLNPGLRE